jgi:chemotaxis protein MotB
MQVIERRKKKRSSEGAPDWMVTYGDMTTLILTFFVLLYTAATVSGSKLQIIISAFTGLGNRTGGNTLQAGKLAELGNDVTSLPSETRGRELDRERNTAVSELQSQIKSQQVRVTMNERGLVISLASDAFFKKASAQVDIDSTREVLQKISLLLQDMPNRHFRIEGHTDDTPTDPNGPYPTNWELSSLRAVNVLHYLVDFGANPKQFEVDGFADTKPLVSNATPEGRAYNRRVDIVVMENRQ